MFKTVFAATAALFTSAGAALAGPYVNVETNAGWAGDDYVGATTDVHVGFGGEVGAASSMFRVLSIVAIDGLENETRISGKVGVGIPVTDALGVYGELSAITATDEFDMDDLSVGGKLGVSTPSDKIDNNTSRCVGVLTRPLFCAMRCLRDFKRVKF